MRVSPDAGGNRSGVMSSVPAISICQGKPCSPGTSRTRKG